MKLNSWHIPARLTGAVCAITTMAMALAVSPVHAQSGTVRIDGSSTVYPVTEAVAEEFQKAKRGTKVTVGISGTGGGFKKFCRGEIDIANASRPILTAEMADCAKAGIKFIELPIAFDALTVVINPKNTFVKSLSIAELRRMWEPGAQGKIMTWDQINPAFPKQPIKLFGAGSDSGTFDYFTEAIVGKAKSSRGDYTASEDDNVLVQGVQRDIGAIGYFGYAYFAENRDKLRAVPIVPATGGAGIEPSEQTVLGGKYQPLSRPIFIYVSDAGLKRGEVRDFVDYYLRNGAKLAKEVKYVPLPARAYELALEHVKAGRRGTVFGGVPEVGITIEELMKREAK